MSVTAILSLGFSCGCVFILIRVVLRYGTSVCVVAAQGRKSLFLKSFSRLGKCSESYQLFCLTLTFLATVSEIYFVIFSFI